MTEMEQLRQLMEALPIYATRVGYRTDSTPEEREFADAIWKVVERWDEVKPQAVRA